MSFVTQEDVFAAIEPVISGVFQEFANGKSVTPSPWPRIAYADSVQKYGTDKPDLRIRNPYTNAPLEIGDVSEAFRGSNFKVFARLLEAEKNRVWAIPAPGGGQRTFCDRMNSWAQSEGQPGLGTSSGATLKERRRPLAPSPTTSGRSARKPFARSLA